MFRLSSLPGSLRLASSVACLVCIPVFSQEMAPFDSLPDLMAKYNKRLGPGPRQAAGGPAPTSDASANATPPGLAYYTANYTSLKGKQLAFNIVGTDPSLGAGTTTVPTIIVPMKLIFPNAPSLPLDGTNVVSANVNSPLFLTADYTTGGTDLGTTQYGDAIQRAEFYNLPGFSANYHVLLGTPTIAATVTVTIPSGKGTLYRLRSGGLLGVVDTTYWDQVLAGLLPAYTANQLPIFLTDNAFLGDNGVIGNCCILGFHSSQSAPIATAQTWIYAAHTEAGTFNGNVIADVQPLSHEVAEWLNDPFVGAFPVGINLIPPAVLPGTGGQCIINFETGDPLESPPVVFTKVTNGTTYHLQDEVFLPWYLHSSPSFSVNGWFTFLNAFPTFSTLCGAG